jgi:hypothetical protein
LPTYAGSGPLRVSAAIAPLPGGTLVRFIGFGVIGYAAILLVAIESSLINLTHRVLRRITPF